MNCLTCGHKNPGTVGYCQRCGGKMDLTADEIRDALVEKAKGEEVQKTEFYARQSLVFSAVILLVAITLLALSTGAPEEAYYAPSASSGAKYLEVNYKNEKLLELQKLPIPIVPQKRK
jgi:hypothetical protein